MERKVDETLHTVRAEFARLEADGRAQIARGRSRPGTPARLRLGTRSADGGLDRCATKQAYSIQAWIVCLFWHS